jgi:hypothetical protein
MRPAPVVDLRIKLGHGALCFLGLVVTTALYGIVLHLTKDPAFWKELAGFCGAAAAVWAAVWAAGVSSAGGEALYHHEQIIRAVDLIERISTQEHVRVRVLVQEAMNSFSVTTSHVLLEKIENSAELKVSVRYHLATLEDLSIALQHGYCDEQLVYDSMRAIVRTSTGGLSAWINQQRLLFKENDLYCEVVKLEEAWSKGVSVRDAAPLSRR